MLASNPGNIGHGWCKKYFIDNGDQVLFTDPQTGLSRVFIKALIDDHPDAAFRAHYIRILEAIQNERLRKALRWGDWNAFEGQVFMEWDERIHVIDKLPYGTLGASRKYIGYDRGRRDPGCAIWIAHASENEEGVRHYYAYREFYQQWKTAKQWVTEIKEVTDGEPIEYAVLPHDCFSIGSEGEITTAERFGEQDVPYVRANTLSHGARMHRQDILHELLQVSPDGKPYLLVHKNCANLIRTIPDLPYSETKREEIDSNAEDHAFDALTYGLIVIDDAESWIVKQKEPESRVAVTPYVGNSDGTTSITGIDLNKVLREGMRNPESWKYAP